MRTIALTLAVAGLLLSCGCRRGDNVQHRLTLKDGTVVVTKAKPVLNKQSGYYRYTTLAGKTVMVKVEDVLNIQRNR